MRRTTLAVTLLAFPLTLAAQQPPHPIPAPAATHDTAPARTTALPITHVSLYKNGVGFFEHTGRVSGDAAVTIDFTTDQLNDVLQSLTAIDLNGGRISGAGYNSTTPLDQQLKSLPLALGTDPTAADFYNAIRGARIAVTASGATITGRLLSIEIRSVPEKSDNTTPGQPSIDHYFLTVVSDTGEVRTVELTSTSSVHLLETDLHQDVTRYLQLLAGNRSQGLRHLTLQDRGSGSRELRVSYISEVPIWKSTYRILFSTDAPTKSPGGPSVASSATGGEPHMPGTATLQGWAVVDNTVGEDWTNVQLSLIAGAPQSFIQPLSTPIYSRRPEIPIAQEAQLTPQTHDSSIEANAVASDSVTVTAASPTLAMPKSRANLGGGMHGMLGGTGSGVGYGNGQPMGAYLAGSVPPPPTYEEQAEASLAPNTQTASFDDFFSYNLSEPVTIRKNESALVPILQAKLPADPVTLVSSNGSQISQPLRALWITNTTNLTLDRGSFSLVENGAFGGEGLLDPIHPNEKRLLSYAADQAVHISTEKPESSRHVTYLQGTKGWVAIHHTDSHEVTYIIHNSAADPRSVVLEHPVQAGFKLDSDTPSPTETTPSVYRFRVEVPSGQTTKLHVGGKHNSSENYHLTDADDNQLTFILQSSEDNPALEAALQPIIEARRRVTDAQSAVNETNTKLTALRSDEDRQRANITALQNADKASRDRFVHDLNKTEDAIAAAQSELTTRTTTLEADKADLSTKIESFSIDTK